MAETHIIQHQQIIPTQVIQVGQPQPLQPPQPPVQYQNIPNVNNQIVHIDNNTVVTTTTIIWEHRFVEIYSKF